MVVVKAEVRGAGVGSAEQKSRDLLQCMVSLVLGTLKQYLSGWSKLRSMKLCLGSSSNSFSWRSLSLILFIPVIIIKVIIILTILVIFALFLLSSLSLNKIDAKRLFLYLIIIQQEVSSIMSSNIPLSLGKEEEIEVLVQNKLKFITGSSMSPNRKYILVTTVKGFVLINSNCAQFTRFQGQKSPFYKNQSTPHGVKLGSIIQSRSEVALVPNFNSKRFISTSVYIFDYSIGIILSSFDFILPIRQFSLTDRYLIASNNKRIVLYNYLKGSIQGSQHFYIEAFKSNENIGSVRYLELNCQKLDESNVEFDSCECGQFALTRTAEYLKIFYLKVAVYQNAKHKNLYYYDEVTGKSKLFDGIQTWTQQFTFSLTEDGKYLVIAEDFGRKIKVFNLRQNCLHTVLHVSRDPRAIINLGIITLPNKSEWVIASRQKQNDLATMHLFKLTKSAPTDHIESNFKRYFRLYKECSVQEDVFARKDQFLGPEFYLVKQRLCCLALQGEFCELIDLNREGLHQRVHVKDYRRLQETQMFIQ